MLRKSFFIPILFLASFILLSAVSGEVSARTNFSFSIGTDYGFISIGPRVYVAPAPVYVAPPVPPRPYYYPGYYRQVPPPPPHGFHPPQPPRHKPVPAPEYRRPGKPAPVPEYRHPGKPAPAPEYHGGPRR